MTEYLNVVTGFPTIVFSCLLVVVVLFWLLSLLGLADLEFFDVDLDVDGSSASSDHTSLFGDLSGWLLRFGLNGVPLTVVISVVVLLAWLASCFASSYVLNSIGPGWLRYGAGAVFIPLCTIAVLPVTGLLLRPLRSVLKPGATALEKEELLGQMCEVRSAEVTPTFGQGYVDDGGAGLLLDIRCEEPNAIGRGDIVAIWDYDRSRDVFLVMPEEEFMK